MPALPFFSLAPSVSQASPSTPLVQDNLNQSKGLQGPDQWQTLSDESASDTLNSPFWQQLQSATEQFELPQGQELAAFAAPLLPKVITTQSMKQMDIDLDSTKALQAQIYNGELSITNIQETDTLNLEDSTGASLQGFQFIESQRQAQPHLQTNTHTQQAQMDQSMAQVMSPERNRQQALDNAGPQLDKTLESPLTQRINASAQMAAGQVNPETQATTQAVNSRLVADSMKLNNNRLSDELNTELPEGLDSELLETKPIHEKPITLATSPSKDATQMQPLQATSVDTQTLTEGKALAQDALQGIARDGQTHQKSMALDTQSQTQGTNTEKAPATFNKLDVPPNHPQWNDQVAKRVMIMANESMQSARIQLDPPELGALEVKIKVQHDQVSVSFGSNNQMVRDALEAQSPRLRELMEQQGINLADVDVSEHASQQSGQDAQGEFAEGGTASDDGTIEADAQDTQTVTLESDSLVDYFA